MAEPSESKRIREFRAAIAKWAKGIEEEARRFAGWQRQQTGKEREAADALWAEYERKKTSNAGPAPQTATPRVPADRGRRQHHGASARGGGRPQSPQQRGDNANAGDPSKLGEPFHHAYTFVPFSKRPPKRRAPTLLTVDELERDRFTGTIELELKTLSPLLSCSPRPTDPGAEHKSFEALHIDGDVIVPATGVRGALRTLLTIVTGGTLGYLDQETWLTQGRDVQLGPAGARSPSGTPKKAFLARVVRAGSSIDSGVIELGKTAFVELTQLEGRMDDLRSFRPQPNKGTRYFWADGPACDSVSERRDSAHPWQIKLSGEPVNKRGKREGLFLGDGRTLTLGPETWSAYAGRNRHGDHPELRDGDLVWLELRDPDAVEVRSADDIESIQWARWGRGGERLLDVVKRHHPQVLPDDLRGDGLVDEVTDLFGQIPDKRSGEGRVSAFAARVRPENAVFRDAHPRHVERVTLAPLAPPHPGCAAFYRDWDGAAEGLDRIANHEQALRGYKVYRATRARGEQAPWRYEMQGVYGDRGELKPRQQKVNKTVELLKQGALGRLTLACRGLSDRELALILAACGVDWRLGGGKPLGLGLVRIMRARVVDEAGTERWSFSREADAPAPLPGSLAQHLDEEDLRRLHCWQSSQQPVAKLRYPRAVQENSNRKSRGGHAWFARHASPKKDGAGLQVLWVDGELKQSVGTDKVRAQALPRFDPADPEGGVLFGHDLLSREEDRTPRGQSPMFHRRLEPFQEEAHRRESDRSGGHQGQTRESRQQGRKRRE